MAIKFEKITPGMILLDIHSQRVGNTTMTALGCWKVYVRSVDPVKRTVVASWNGNRDEVWPERRITRLYAKETKAYREQKERQAKGRWI